MRSVGTPDGRPVKKEAIRPERRQCRACDRLAQGAAEKAAALAVLAFKLRGAFAKNGLAC